MAQTNSDISVAIIGAGNIAAEHIKAFTGIDGVKVTGIFSRTRSKSEALAVKHAIPIVADSIDSLYEQTQADIVIIAVSVAHMPDVTGRAASYPWALLLEKPPANGFQAYLDLVRVIGTAAQRCYVAMNRRYLSSTLALGEWVSDEDAPRFVHVQDEQRIKNIMQMNVHPPEVIERFMYANSIHLIDYFSVFCRGECTSVDVLSPWRGTEHTDVVLAYLSFDSGDKGLYEAHWTAPAPWAVTVTSTKGRWELRPLESARYQLPASRVWHDVEPDTDDVQYKPGFRKQALTVINHLKGQPADIIRLADVYRTYGLIHKIYGID